MSGSAAMLSSLCDLTLPTSVAATISNRPISSAILLFRVALMQPVTGCFAHPRQTGGRSANCYCAA
jgi:hypothetical protein